MQGPTMWNNVVGNTEKGLESSSVFKVKVKTKLNFLILKIKELSFKIDVNLFLVLHFLLKFILCPLLFG